MPLLTVAIPVFNAMPHLPASLESILGQSYRDFEILVVNDGSTDGSLEYLQSIRTSRLRIINQKNQGLTATLNRMLAEVSTPWMVRQDADDIAYPQRLARTAEYIKRFPQSGMFCSLADYYPRGCYGQFRATRGTPEHFRDLVLSGYLPSCCHPTVTLNVERTIAVGGYGFNLFVEDIDLWWRMALKHDIRLIPEATLGLRQNLQSTSSANLAKQALHTLYIQYLLLSHLWDLAPLPYELACQELSSLLDSRMLKFKTHLRGFNMEMGRGNRFEALWKLAAAFVTSPACFSQRLIDELLAHQTISLGEQPYLFFQNLNALWPSAGVPPKVMGDLWHPPNNLKQYRSFLPTMSTSSEIVGDKD
jgi:hypothetical protein